MNNLSDLELQKMCKIKSIDLKGPMERRLRDLGLIEGTNVTCVLISPFGDPKAYNIRGGTIAIRNKDASLIITE